LPNALYHVVKFSVIELWTLSFHRCTETQYFIQCLHIPSWKQTKMLNFFFWKKQIIEMISDAVYDVIVYTLCF